MLYCINKHKLIHFIGAIQMASLLGVANIATVLGGLKTSYDVINTIGSYWSTSSTSGTVDEAKAINSNLPLTGLGKTVKPQKCSFLNANIQYSSDKTTLINTIENVTPEALMSTIWYRPCTSTTVGDITKPLTGTLKVTVDKCNHLFHYTIDDVKDGVKSMKLFTGNPYGIDTLLFGACGANVLIHCGTVEAALRARLLPYIDTYAGIECGAIMALFMGLMWPQQRSTLITIPFLKWTPEILGKITSGLEYIINIFKTTDFSTFHGKKSNKRIFKGQLFQNWLACKAAELSVLVNNGCDTYQTDVVRIAMETWLKDSTSPISTESHKFDLTFDQLKVVTGIDLHIHGNECIYSCETTPKHSIINAVRKSMALPFIYETVHDFNIDDSTSEVATGSPNPMPIGMYDHNLYNGLTYVPLFYYRHMLAVNIEYPFSTGDHTQYAIQQIERGLKRVSVCNDLDGFESVQDLANVKDIGDLFPIRDSQQINLQRQISIRSNLTHADYMASTEDKNAASNLGYTAMLTFLASRLEKLNLIGHGMPASQYLPSIWYTNRIFHGETYLPSP
jgi:hypothetical protein